MHSVQINAALEVAEMRRYGLLAIRLSSEKS